MYAKNNFFKDVEWWGLIYSRLTLHLNGDTYWPLLDCQRLNIYPGASDANSCDLFVFAWVCFL